MKRPIGQVPEGFRPIDPEGVSWVEWARALNRALVRQLGDGIRGLPAPGNVGEWLTLLATGPAWQAYAASTPGASAPGLYSGQGAPTATDGADGSFYLDRDTGDLWGPRASGKWPSPPLALGKAGPKGDQGPPGQSGDGQPILVLASGQSNMVGAGTGGTFRVDDRVKIWRYDTGQFVTVNILPHPVPLEKPVGDVGPDATIGDGGENNLACAFAHRLNIETGRPVYLVVSAKGNKNLDEWISAGTASPMYALLKSTIEAAMVGLDKPTVDYFLWSQGENNQANSQAVYAAKLATFLAQLRAEDWFNQWTPFITNQLIQPYPGGGGAGVIAAQTALNTDTDPYTCCALSTSLTSGTADVHFDGASLWELGFNRYWEAYELYYDEAPAASISGTDNHVVRMDGTSGLQDSLVVIDDSGNVTTPGGVTSGDGTAVATFVLNGLAGVLRALYFQTAGVSRWAVRATTNAEAGASAGSAFHIVAFDDAGALIDTPVEIIRALAGQINLNRKVALVGGGNAATPAVYFDVDSDSGLYRIGSNDLGLSAAGTQQLHVDSDGLKLDRALATAVIIGRNTNITLSGAHTDVFFALSASRSATFPAASSCAGRVYGLGKTSGAGFNVVATPDGTDTIGGVAGTYLIKGVGQLVRFKSDGVSDWKIISALEKTLSKGASWDNGITTIVAADCSEVNVYCPIAGTIVGWTIVTEGGVGSCVVDVWKRAFSSGMPAVGNTITAAAKPTVSGADRAQSSTLTGWTTAIAAGDILTFHVDSTSVFSGITISLDVIQ